jgi:hypothetical protein
VPPRPPAAPHRSAFRPSGSLELRYAPEWRPFPTEAAEPQGRGFRLSWQLAAIGAGVLVVLIGLLLFLGSLRPGPSSTARSDVSPPVVATTAPVLPTAPPPRSGGLPAPVPGSLGSTVRVAGLRLTVVSAASGVVGARPSPAPRPGARFYVVEVLYENASGRPAIVSPYDWTLTDQTGAVYGAVEPGLPNDLTDRLLPSGGEARGLIGFEVPPSAAGLTVHFEAELGDEGAVVPIG